MLLRLYQEFENIQKRDNKYIRKSQRRRISNEVQDIGFKNKISNGYVVIKLRAFEICDILERTLDYPMLNLILRQNFDRSLIISVLQDKEFVAFMLEANLIKRTLNLDYGSNNAFAIRLYLAILNFDGYQKKRWCE